MIPLSEAQQARVAARKRALEQAIVDAGLPHPSAASADALSGQCAAVACCAPSNSMKPALC